jgi:hypothetical protein
LAIVPLSRGPRRNRSDRPEIPRPLAVIIERAIAVVAEKVGVIETARELLERRAGKAKPKDLLKYLRKAGHEQPTETDDR